MSIKLKPSPKYKYNEDNILRQLQNYIDSTYQQHYVGKNNIQTIDMWQALGSADTTARDTALKYLMRFGKKDGLNKKDLLKAMHYTILLWHFTYGDNDEAPSLQQNQTE